MLSSSLYVLLLSVGMASVVFAAGSDDRDDGNGTFIVLDVRADKSSVGGLNSAFNNLKRPEYAVKIIGEERGIFVVRDDDDCNTLQSDFHGLQVKAIPTRGRPDDVVLNDTGLVVVVIQSTLDRDTIRQALDNALDRCDNCFKVFATYGRKPQKCILIGNIPIDQISDIIDNTTADKCCDSAYTRRAMEFNTFRKSHSVGCIDAKSQVKSIPSPRISPRKVQPIKPSPFVNSKPLHPLHPFPDVKHEAKENAKIPVAPHKGFPPHEIKPPKIEHPNFDDKFTFPGLKGDSGSKFPSYGFAPHSKSDAFF